ncbi:hypothetical protein CDAR_283911 [Caerostris darwini]|uniref:Uncharacterized protein n=1 Tax=Caerostris darwini TaxID=1538125 RepID=A0AAV4PL19_9ARAC|nr:hypothetical protein CDAR_283911 [Caerostris darwini]
MRFVFWDGNFNRIPPHEKSSELKAGTIPLKQPFQETRKNGNTHREGNKTKGQRETQPWIVSQNVERKQHFANVNNRNENRQVESQLKEWKIKK